MQQLHTVMNILFTVHIYTVYIYIYIYIYTVPSINIGTLDKYEQRRLWKYICIVYPFYLSFQKFTKFQRIIEVKQLKMGGNLTV